MSNLYGTNVSATIKPFTTADNFPTHEAQYGKGGYRTVNSESDLTSIPLERLEKGMLVYTINSNKIYKYIGDTTTNRFPEDWEELVLSSSGGSDEYFIVDNLNQISNPTVGILAYVTSNNEVYKYTSNNEWVLLVEENNNYQIVNSYSELANISNLFQGMLAYTKDTNEIYKYTGSNWVKIIPDTITHTFTNQSTLTIAHNLNKIPTVIITDQFGNQIYSDIQLNLNNITINFSESISGTVYIR